MLKKLSLFAIFSTLILGACSQSALENNSGSSLGMEATEEGTLEDPTFQLEPVSETEKTNPPDGPEAPEPNEPTPTDPDTESQGEIQYIPFTNITFNPQPVSELDFRLVEYGETLGQENLAILRTAWENCHASFDPNTHKAQFNNAFLCFLLSSDSELSELFKKIDAMAVEAKSLHALLMGSHPGAQNEAAFAKIVNDRVNLLTQKLHQMTNKTSTARSRMVKYAELFNIPLSTVSLGPSQNSDNYNWVVKDYFKDWLFSSTSLALANLYRSNNIEAAMGWELSQLKETFSLLHLAGSFLVGPATDTTNFVSFIQFDPTEKTQDPFIQGVECQGALIPLMKTLDFDYMR